MNVNEYIENTEDPWALKKIGVISGRADFIKKAAGTGKSILDVGGGYGFYAEELRKSGNDVTVLDDSEKMITEGKSLFPELGFVNGNATDIPFMDENFDIVLCMGTLIYVSNRKKFVSEVMRVLKPGGRFILIERNKNALLNKMVRLFKETEQPVDNINDFITKNELKILLKNSFRTEKLKGRFSNFLYCIAVKQQ
ncbi:MAG: class I SAM-dependent methyltransferase [Candidatus Aenigmatarchaeota archaeon]